MDYFSQNGEDFILDLLFKKKTDGYFVEVGCIDGKRFSNTLHFERKGWKGICVEAHTDYIELLNKNRNSSIVVHAAVGEKDEENVSFYANDRGSLSSLDQSQEDRFKKDYSKWFSGFKVQNVPKRTLTTIFKNNKVEHIDFLSLDIEGYEIEAMIGLDLNQFRPTVIVVESDTIEHERKLNSILFRNGYFLIGRIGGNLFYSVDKNIATNIKNKKFQDIPLTKTEHPLDNDGTKKIVTTVRLKKYNWLETLLKKIIS